MLVFSVSLDNIYESLSDLDTGRNFSTLTLRKNKLKVVSSWSLDDLFSVQIDTVSRLNTDVNRTVEVSFLGILSYNNNNNNNFVFD